LIYDAVLFVEELNKANAPAEAVQSGEEPEQKLTPKGPTD
jgi:hypothetical protein